MYQICTIYCLLYERSAGRLRSQSRTEERNASNHHETLTLMDQCAVKAFNLLGEYDPEIPPKILDVLQIGDEKGLIDLQTVQRYLEERKSNCQYYEHTIFGDPREGCFAEQYFLRSKDSEMLQSIYKRIQTATEKARERKREQWLSLSAEYNSLQRKIASASCDYTYTEGGYQPNHDSRHCTKCFLFQKAGRMSIHLHEDPLPVNPSQTHAVVFELNCPEAFSAYRNTTWMIIRSLAVSEPIKSQPPKLLLREYSEVKPFISSTSIEGVCLASVSKSRLKMHFNPAMLPARWDEVCVHNTLRLRYFDTKTESWTGRKRGRLSFAHHCAFVIPSDSPFAPLLESPKFDLTPLAHRRMKLLRAKLTAHLDWVLTSSWHSRVSYLVPFDNGPPFCSSLDRRTSILARKQLRS